MDTQPITHVTSFLSKQITSILRKLLTRWHELPDFLVCPPPDPLVDVSPLLFRLLELLLVDVGVENILDVLGVGHVTLHQTLLEGDEVPQEQGGSFALGRQGLKLVANQQ